MFKSTAPYLYIFRPLRSLSCNCKIYIQASLYIAFIVNCLGFFLKQLSLLIKYIFIIKALNNLIYIIKLY